MISKVKVTGDELGHVVIQSKNNPEWGHIRVTQRRIFFEDGFARVKEMSALIAGRMEDLSSFGWRVGQEIDGKIVVKESLTPFNKKDPNKDLKVAGVTGIICRIDDQPVYRKTVYTADTSAEDEHIRDEFGNVITHNNVDEIREAYQTLNSSESLANF